jgi:hypothetical protein
MKSVSQPSSLEETLSYVLEERAKVVARETGCVQRQVKFNGATLLQTVVFGWLQHPAASLESLASTAAIRAVSVTDTAIHKRFTPQCARFLHRMLEEISQVVVLADQDVPLALVRRFRTVVIEDSSSIALPDALAEQWRGCGGNQAHTAAAVKLHVRWDLKRGRLWGPALTAGRASDHSSPWADEALPPKSLYCSDLGYFHLGRLAQRHQAKVYSLTRLRAGTALFSAQGKRLQLSKVLPPKVGQMKEMRVQVGASQRLPMRLLLLRVPKQIGDKRRADLLADAQRRGQRVSEETLRLADWTVLITDAPTKRLRFEEALVLLRERWQMELLYKLWKQHGQVDEWRTSNPWRVLCAVYAKLIGMLLQHWLIVRFAWQDAQRSLVKLAQVVRDTAWTIMEAFGGERSLASALRLIGRRMHSGCHLNKRKKHPNSAQLLEQEAVEWALSW